MNALDQIVQSQKSGRLRGITSICSAHPSVLREALRSVGEHPECLIEATCNQVNQYGGYTGMTPRDFVRYVQGIATENDFPADRLILGGDHLGPNPWRAEAATAAMQKASTLVRDFVEAGFTKIHLDCSMRLADDPPGAPDVGESARRTALLAKVAERSLPAGSEPPRYVIGTEVPTPGGMEGHDQAAQVTSVESAALTIRTLHEAFERQGLQAAWDRVVALVVQPGVEFGDDSVQDYKPALAKDLSHFIESQPMIYEVHSTDYQSPQALRQLVRDHFAILKVGPALTFAYREAIFALAMIEAECYPTENSQILGVIEQAMQRHPGHWDKHYVGTEAQQAFKRKFSFSDRIRYYWFEPDVRAALERLMRNLAQEPLPLSLVSQFAPLQYEQARRGEIAVTPESLISARIRAVLAEYAAACTGA